MKKILILSVLLLSGILCFSACGDDHTHSYTAWSTLVEATCTKSGMLTRSCTGCGNTENSAVDALGHKLTDIPEKAATCSAEGNSFGQQCSVCHEYTVTPVIKAKLAHVETELAATPATCSADGLTSGKQCTLCGEMTVPQTKTAKLAHAEKTLPAVSATCTEAGLTEGTMCTLCNQVLTAQQPVPAGEHIYAASITRDASCVQSGIKSLVCTVCGESKTEEFELQKYTGSQIHEMTKDSVGVISTYTKGGDGYALGTGFVLSEDGKIVTNYHVIEHAFSAEIVLAGKTYSIDNVLAYDPDVDLAIVKINASGLTPIKICTEAVPTGSAVFAFGNPKGYVATFSQGVVTYSNREIGNVTYIQHDAAISSGNSGGPLINEYCEVIGINTWVRVDGQNLNFAVVASEIENLTYSTEKLEDVYYADHSEAYSSLYAWIKANGEISDEYIDIYQDFDGGYYNLYIDIENQRICVGFFEEFEDGDEYSLYISLSSKAEDYKAWSYYLFVDGEEIYSEFTLPAYKVTPNYSITLDKISNNAYADSLPGLHNETVQFIAEWLSGFLSEYTYLTAADFGFVWY